MGDDEADLLVRDFGREGFLEGLEVVEAEFCGGLADLFGVDGMDPVGAVLSRGANCFGGLDPFACASDRGRVGFHRS